MSPSGETAASHAVLAASHGSGQMLYCHGSGRVAMAAMSWLSSRVAWSAPVRSRARAACTRSPGGPAACRAVCHCPRTLGTGSIKAGGCTLTVQVCTWIGSSAAGKPDMRRLGSCLAALHTELETSGLDFSDRRLSFERAEPPAVGGTDQDLPPWYIARHIWRHRIMAWLHLQAQVLPAQPVHGDMHWANIVPTSSGFGFIDFDKVMSAPPVFDLAKLIATGFFEIGAKVRFREQLVAQLVEGYTARRSLTTKEGAALEGLALLLNEETARIGMVYGVDTYREQAAAVAGWWIARRRRRATNPLGIRDLLDPAPAPLVADHQLPLWPGHDFASS